MGEKYTAIKMQQKYEVLTMTVGKSCILSNLYLVPSFCLLLPYFDSYTTVVSVINIFCLIFNWTFYQIKNIELSTFFRKKFGVSNSLCTSVRARVLVFMKCSRSVTENFILMLLNVDQNVACEIHRRIIYYSWPYNKP